MPIAPDTQQNLIYAIYFAITHNLEAFIYLGGALLVTVWALFKPSRGKILMLWGFIILLFAFEYNKHILEPLRQQTIGSLVTERQSFRIEQTINYATMRVLPKIMPVIGWFLVIFGMVFDYILMLILKKDK